MNLLFSAADLRAAMARMTLKEQQQLVALVETALTRPELERGPGPMRCAHCARLLVQPATGRPRRFCSDRCRVNAALRRKLGASEDAARHQLEGRW